MKRIFAALLAIMFLAAGCAVLAPPPPLEQPPLSERMGLPPGYDIEVIYSAPLACPAGITLTPTGDFLITENYTGYVKKVTPEGKVTTITTLPIPATAVGYNSLGEPFVGGNGGIWKLSPEGEPSKFSDVGVSKIAFGPDGYLYTVNWHGGPHPEIMKISPQGEATTFFTGLSRPSGIAFSPSGELYVADPGAQRIVKVNDNGTLTTVVSGLWTDPIGIGFDKQGTLYFTSGWAEKVEYGLFKVSPTDASISSVVPSPPILGCCEDMAIDDTGNIFLISVTYGMLYKVNPQGEITILVEGWHNPFGMVSGPSGELFIADFSRCPLAQGRILKLDMEGNVTTFIEDLHYPNDLAFDNSENMFVSDPYGQILKITPQGEKQIFADHLPNPQSMAYDPVSGDLFVFLVATDEILRITPEGDTFTLAADFGEDVFSGRIAVDNQGNLFACVVYAKNYGIGPTFSSLFNITTDGNVKLLAEFTDEVPCAEVDLAVSPYGDAFLLGHPLDGFEIRNVTPEGEVSVFATSLPVDPFGITFNAEGDLFFSCATGIYRIFRTG